MKKLRILVADDHGLVRRGARALLHPQQGWRVVGEAANGRVAVETELDGRLAQTDVPAGRRERDPAVIRQRIRLVLARSITSSPRPLSTARIM